MDTFFDMQVAVAEGAAVDAEGAADGETAIELSSLPVDQHCTKAFKTCPCDSQSARVASVADNLGQSVAAKIGCNLRRRFARCREQLVAEILLPAISAVVHSKLLGSPSLSSSISLPSSFQTAPRWSTVPHQVTF